MNTQKKEKVLIIDSKSQNLEDEDSLTIHPKKMQWLNLIQKESFDRAVVQNSATTFLKPIYLFYLAQAIKQNTTCVVYVDQPLSVMQQLDASEIEANAKLGGFINISITDYEKWRKEGEKNVRISTLKVTMVRPEKISMKKEVK